MIWLLCAVIGIVLLIALAALVGTFRPKGHVVSRTAQFDQSVEAVWVLLSDFQNAPSWCGDVRSVEREPDREGHSIYKETYKNKEVMLYETLESTPPRRLVRKIVDNKQFGGCWTIEIQPAGSRSTVTITEDGEIYNPIFRFVFMFMNPAMTIEKYLGFAAKHFAQPLELVS